MAERELAERAVKFLEARSEARSEARGVGAARRTRRSVCEAERVRGEACGRSVCKAERVGGACVRRSVWAERARIGVSKRRLGK